MIRPGHALSHCFSRSSRLRCWPPARGTDTDQARADSTATTSPTPSTATEIAEAADKWYTYGGETALNRRFGLKPSVDPWARPAR